MFKTACLMTIASFFMRLAIQVPWRCPRAGFSWQSGILFVLFITQALSVHAQDAKEVLPWSCPEVYDLFLAAAKDTHETARIQARHLGKLVEWDSIYRGTLDTLWGMEVQAECMSEGGPVRVSVLFDGKYRRSIEKLPSGSHLKIRAVLNGFDPSRGILLTEGVPLLERVVTSQPHKETAKQMANMVEQERSVAPRVGVSRAPARSPWLFPDSDKRFLDDDDLKDLSADILWVARNEIFARRGYIFKTERGKSYARSLGPKYIGCESDEKAIASKFNEFEKYNIEMIKRYER